MKKILIISPHYPPSNLAAVHRARYFAQHLPGFGWNPIILTVHEKYYEEKLDWKLFELIPKDQRIEKVSALPITRPRMIGDLGLRAFFQLRRRALDLIKIENIDFIYILIPSFYVALLGPNLYRKTKVPYGIDYIDPWVHRFPGSDAFFSRHWFSTQLAKILEPIAIKHASLITGVSEGYYLPVLERNTHLKQQALTAAMPYGGEGHDYEYIRKELRDKGQGTRGGERDGSIIIPIKSDGVFRLAYAGAMLPQAYKPLEQIFKALAVFQQRPSIVISFIGTLGTIKPLAEKYGIWNTVIFEHADRIPYLDVLRNLEAADGVFILGSTEPHYTPSKVYQAVLSKKPILAVLHKASTAVNVIQESKSGMCVQMNGELDLNTLSERFIEQLQEYLLWAREFNPNSVDKKLFEQYSTKEVTRRLVGAIERCLA